MRIYRSFLIRCWLNGDGVQAPGCLFDIRNVQTGEQARATNVAGIQRLMVEACERARHEQPPAGEKNEDVPGASRLTTTWI